MILIFKSVHQADLTIQQSMNLARKKFVRLLNYIQQIAKTKNPRYPPQNLNRRPPVVNNKKPENQDNFQRVKHAINDRNIPL